MVENKGHSAGAPSRSLGKKDCSQGWPGSQGDSDSIATDCLLFLSGQQCQCTPSVVAYDTNLQSTFSILAASDEHALGSLGG